MNKNEALKSAIEEVIGVQLIDNTPEEARQARWEINEILARLADRLQQPNAVDAISVANCPKCGQPDPVLHCENCGHNRPID